MGIERERRTELRPLPPGRRRRRDIRHVDQVCLELARLSVGTTVGAFAGIFGSPTAALCQLPYYTAPVINFPERRSDLAKLKAEIAEINRTVRGGCC
jgi:hypothetical protein